MPDEGWPDAMGTHSTKSGLCVCVSTHVCVCVCMHVCGVCICMQMHVRTFPKTNDALADILKMNRKEKKK